LSGFVSSFDLHTKLENGFCHGRYDLYTGTRSVYLDRPVLQVGKYNGDAPFIIEASGSYASEVFAQEFMIEESAITGADTLAEEIWAGNYINFLEKQPQTNDIVTEIVDLSIEERVLSVYSAFLCLEPERGGQICYDCMDESELVGIAESRTETEADSLFMAYPNPFNSKTTIAVRLPASVDRDKVSMRIHNTLGQAVRTFRPQDSAGGRSYRIEWDGTNDAGTAVSSGHYYFILDTGQKHYTMKLLLLK
jgi:hypothetical protein